MELQPLLELQILFHPAPARVQDQEAELQRPSFEKVLFDKLLPLGCYFLGDTRVPVSGQIDEVELSVDPVKIDQLRTAGSCTGKRQPVLARQAIQQAGLAYITSSQKRDLRERFSRKLIRPGCTDYKFR